MLKKQIENNNNLINLINYNQIEIVNQIGEGGQGVVESGKWNGIPVAVKHIFQYNAQITKEEITERLNETSLLIKMNHPLIVRYYKESK